MNAPRELLLPTDDKRFFVEALNHYSRVLNQDDIDSANKFFCESFKFMLNECSFSADLCANLILLIGCYLRLNKMFLLSNKCGNQKITDVDNLSKTNAIFYDTISRMKVSCGYNEELVANLELMCGCFTKLEEHLLSNAID